MKIQHFAKNGQKFSVYGTQKPVHLAQFSVYHTQKTHLPILVYGRCRKHPEGGPTSSVNIFKEFA